MIRTIIAQYEGLGYAIEPIVSGMTLTVPAATATVAGTVMDLAEATFDLSGANGGEGDYTVYITPAGYCLEILRPDGTVENPRSVFPEANAAYWVCSFHLTGTETALDDVVITVLHAEEVVA